MLEQIGNALPQRPPYPSVTIPELAVRCPHFDRAGQTCFFRHGSGCRHRQAAPRDSRMPSA